MCSPLYSVPIVHLLMNQCLIPECAYVDPVPYYREKECVHMWCVRIWYVHMWCVHMWCVHACTCMCINPVPYSRETESVCVVCLCYSRVFPCLAMTRCKKFTKSQLSMNLIHDIIIIIDKNGQLFMLCLSLWFYFHQTQLHTVKVS